MVTYLQRTSPEEARARWFQALEAAGWFTPAPQTVPTRAAGERIVAEAVHARRDVPPHPAAAMDGIALRAADTVAARRDRPLVLKRPAFVRVDTGDHLPEGCDAVVMLEELHFLDEDTVELRRAAFPGQHVRPRAEDFREGDLVLPARARLTPEAVAACLATGHRDLPVIPRPRAFVLPTGCELVPAERDPLPPGKHPETNSALFVGLLRRWGAEPCLQPLIEDDPDALRAALERARPDHDLFLINAGTAKGREDFTVSVLRELGQVLVHGVSMHPGHPTVLGLLDGKPAVGVPGYPVACWITLEQFVLPLLERYAGCALEARLFQEARLARRVASPLGEVEFVRVRLERREDGLWAHPLPGKASALSSLVGADALLEIPAALNGHEAGERVRVRLLHPLPAWLSR